MKTFKFTIEGHPFEVSVDELGTNVVEVNVNGSKYTVEVDHAGAPIKAPSISRQVTTARPLSTPTTPVAAPVVTSKATTVKSQLPGSIIKVLVADGATVKKGDTVLTMESMKMENEIKAEADGVVVKLHVAPGQNVMQDEKLYDFASAGAPAAAPAAAPVQAPAPKPAPAAAPVAAPVTVPAGDGKPLKAPLPGSIIKILVEPGKSVKRGETLLTMESMKMENEIKAEKDGVIVDVKVQPGQNVMQDETLLIIA